MRKPRARLIMDGVDRTRLAALWALNLPIRHIADHLGVSESTIHKISGEMKLPRNGRKRWGVAMREHIGARGDILHRTAIRQPDPVRLRPCRSLFGAPIRDLDPNTRALIDAALGRSA